MSDSLSATLQQLSEDPRVTVRRAGAPKHGGKCVLYWMQRAQRGMDNHAVDIAVYAANALGLPLIVYFAAIANFPSANLRHYVFLNQGLPDIEEDLAARNVSFVLRCYPRESHEQMIADVDPALLIGDENPMRGPESWRRTLAESISIPFWTVDADVIVPSKLIVKAQYGAYTIRPRLYRMLPDYLRSYENPAAQHTWKRPAKFVADDVRKDITAGWTELDRSVPSVEAWHGGHHEAIKRLQHFTEHLLPTYERDRNHPELDGTSMLSPWLHFGHIGPVTIALAVDAAARKHPELQAARDSFFNELIAWRELAVNFVKYSADYDNPACAENWAKLSITEHARDEREHLYTLAQLEHAETHDSLWNAAQQQMVHSGWMHNYMRMDWAKKILEWTPDVATAMSHAIYLNDKYFLDGRDPNGYAGIAWSMVGKFDRAWFERPIFGKIRYMSGASTGKKFNSKEYIRQMQTLAGGEPQRRMF
ncbi:MAG TPA: deoxyribodipyrimidine photo-lyase [Acidobacteriaceae bacterium]